MTSGNALQKKQRNCTFSCTLLVPGLLDLPPQENGIEHSDQTQLKTLELFLARAQREPDDQTGFETVLFDQFDVNVSVGQELPVAPVSYLGDTGNTADGWCLRADPVQLLPGRDDLILSGPETLLLTLAEAKKIAAELNDLFEQDGWRIEAVTPTRWYLHLSNDPQIRTHDLSQVRGHSIGQFLPGGAEGKKWHRILNEVQMVLHSCSVNIDRQTNGFPPVSSLWFWGGGQLPECGRSRWNYVWSDELLSRGLAKATSTPCLSISENSKAWLSQVDTAGEHLIVCDDFSFLEQEQKNDYDNRSSAMREFEGDWLAPLLEALRNGELDQLSLNACDGQTFSLTKKRLKHWWRWRKPIRSYSR